MMVENIETKTERQHLYVYREYFFAYSIYYLYLKLHLLLSML